MFQTCFIFLIFQRVITTVPPFFFVLPFQISSDSGLGRGGEFPFASRFGDSGAQPRHSSNIEPTAEFGTRVSFFFFAAAGLFLCFRPCPSLSRLLFVVALIDGSGCEEDIIIIFFPSSKQSHFLTSVRKRYSQSVRKEKERWSRY